jgi:hypothetical protein
MNLEDDPATGASELQKSFRQREIRQGDLVSAF